MKPTILQGPEDDNGLPHQSLGKIFYDQMKNHQTTLIEYTTNEEINYAQLLKISSRLANTLVKLGVKKGDVITIVAENNWKSLGTIIACFLVGATANLLNHDYTSGELTHFLKITQPVLVFCDSKTEENVLKLKNKPFFNATIITYSRSEKLKNFNVFLDVDDNFKPVPLDPEQEVALILTSSGTTGLPKCVMLTHKNFRVTMMYARDPEGLDINSQEVIVGYLPFFHIFGCALSLASMLYGTKYIILSKFKPDRFLKILRKHQVTKIYAVPPIIQFLAKNPVVDQIDLTSIKDILCGGGPVTKELLELTGKKFKINSVRQVYGMTEISGAATILSKDIVKYGSVGQVTRTYTIKVCDPESGKILPPHHNGELRILGPGLMKGYLGNEQESQNAFDEDGFMRSGDLGYYDDDGFFYIVDRLKEIINYKGFPVSPAELENLLIQHPSVKDVGVVGVPDERAGEVPLAFVVKSPNDDVTEEELVRFIEENVSVQKRLYGGVQFIQEIPKNASGKILRRQLKEMAM